MWSVVFAPRTSSLYKSTTGVHSNFFFDVEQFLRLSSSFTGCHLAAPPRDPRGNVTEYHTTFEVKQVFKTVRALKHRPLLPSTADFCVSSQAMCDLHLQRTASSGRKVLIVAPPPLERALHRCNLLVVLLLFLDEILAFPCSSRNVADIWGVDTCTH